MTVITPTVPERADLLAEAVASVAAQTEEVAHLIGVDRRREGPAVIRNRLIDAADTEWVAFLDDDDLLDPHHLETLYRTAITPILCDEGIRRLDVVYSWCRLDPAGAIGDQFYNNPYDRDALRSRGIFPITALARRQAVLDAGGFHPQDRYEDWSLWNRMADNGCRFACVPEETWTYRFHGADQRTRTA